MVCGVAACTSQAASTATPSGAAQMNALPDPAGEIFGTPVSLANYGFAQRTAYVLPRPWETDQTPEQREQTIWDNLILSYEAFRRNIQVTDDELGQRLDGLIRDQQATFDRKQDPAAYAQWVKDNLKEEVTLFENQMRYLAQIDKLKETVGRELQVTVTGQEMRSVFLDEQNHIGGEFKLFDTQAEADAFYQEWKDPRKWDAKQKEDAKFFRPYSLMTLEAIIDLWGVPRQQVYAFHAMKLGSVGAPMPFGRQWGVFRLLEKRTGDFKDFPQQRDYFAKKIEYRKRNDGIKAWVKELRAAAKLKVYVPAADRR